MPTGFDDPSVSARVRDAIERIAEGILKEKGVTYRYGTVTAINYAEQKVSVQFAGSNDSMPVKTLGVQPTEVGQVVQVTGKQGDHFVSGVVGTTSLVGADPDSLTAPTLTLDPYTESVVASWTLVQNAAAYEVEFAEDNAFTVNPVTFQISGNSFTYHETDHTKTLYARVRALTSHDPPQAGPWSATQGPVSPVEQQGGVSTDGNPPADSPDVTVSSGLGYLQASWPEQTNADPVTYEVHIDTNSGFTPGALTLYDEITGRTSFIDTLADGTPLAYDTDYYVRILAKDADGAAPTAGAQDIAQISRVETGDAGSIGVNNISDGNVPSTSPDVGNVTSGIGYLFVTWAHISNADPVTYEVHVSTVNNFAPDANTRVGDTPSNFFFVREQGPGAGSAPLDYATTYYIKLIAKDADGYAASYGLQGSGSSVRGDSGDIAEDAIGTVHIQDLAVTTALIGDAAIAEAKIQDAAITTAKIADAQISTAKIDDLAVTDAKINDLAVNKLTAGTLTADVIVGTGEISAVGAAGEVLLDGTGLRMWDNTTRTGVPTVEMLAADGSATFTGTITGSTIAGSTLSIAYDDTATTGRWFGFDVNTAAVVEWLDSSTEAGLTPTAKAYAVYGSSNTLPGFVLASASAVIDRSSIIASGTEPYAYLSMTDDGFSIRGADGSLRADNNGARIGGSTVTVDAGVFEVFGTNIYLYTSIIDNVWSFRNDGVTEFPSWLLVPDGNGTTPSVRFKSDTNTGIGLDGADQLSLITGGAQKMMIGTSQNNHYQDVWMQSGSGINMQGGTIDNIGLLVGNHDVIMESGDGGRSLTIRTHNEADLKLSTWTRIRIRGTSPGGLSVTNPDGTAWRDVYAAGFNVQSDERSKTDIAFAADDVLTSIRQSTGGVVARFRRKQDDDQRDPREQFGFIAQDAPAVAQVDMSDEQDESDIGIDLAAMVAYHRLAIEQLAAEVDELRGRLPAPA